MSKGVIYFDLLDNNSYSSLVSAVRENNVSIILDLMASGVTPGSIDESKMIEINSHIIPTFYSNLMSNMPHSLKIFRAETILATTQVLGFHESSYALSKHLGSMKIREIIECGNSSLTQIYLNNIYGNFQPKNRLVASIFEACLQAKPFTLKFPNRVRDFCYVEDVASNFYKIIVGSEKFSKVEKIEIGTGKGTKISDLIEIIEAKLDLKLSVLSTSILNFEDNFLESYSNPSNLLQIGRCNTPISDGIEKTILKLGYLSRRGNF